MKTFKKLTLAMAMLMMALVVHAQKFGHISSDQLLKAMPESDSAQVKMQEIQKQYELDIEAMQVEINKKMQEFSQNEATMSDLIKEAKVSEIQEMQVRLQNFSQAAQQDLQQQSVKLMQPVMDKARKAIDEVAKENGLLYVFDLSQGNPIYASEESLEIMPMVKAKLGIQ